MKTEIQQTELYKKFKEALNIRHDMRSDDNPFVVACCEIAEAYAQQKLNIASVSGSASGAVDTVAEGGDEKCTCPDDQCLLGDHPTCRWAEYARKSSEGQP